MKRIRDRSLDWAWALLVAMLPVTSMPLVVRLVGSDTVAAPSGLFLLFLLFAWFAPYIFRGGTIPRQSIPIFGFGLAAALATAAASFLSIPPFKETDFFRHELQALLTFCVGLSFYLVTVTFVRDGERLKRTLWLINWSGALVLAWSLIQAAAWYRLNYFPEWMEILHRFFSSGVLFKQRVSGLALEPSWYAHQLNMLYLPLWLAATVNRSSVHRWRILGVSFENILLTTGCGVLFLTLSRVGLAAFLLMLGYLLVKLHLRLVDWLRNAVLSRLRNSALVGENQKGRIIWYGAILILLVVIYAGMLWGLVYGMSRVDPRMAEVFKFQTYQDNSILRYAQKLDFGPRMAYWMAGWEIFNDYPVFGVGLGNAGYFFPQKITAYGWNLMEVSEMMYRSANLTNIKSLWVRLLAETGIVGFAFFVTWLYVVWLTGRKLEKCNVRLVRVVGQAGLFVIIGLLLEGFSVDSFALPYIWIMLGLTTGVRENPIVAVLTRSIGKPDEKENSAEQYDYLRNLIGSKTVEEK